MCSGGSSPKQFLSSHHNSNMTLCDSERNFQYVICGTARQMYVVVSSVCGIAEWKYMCGVKATKICLHKLIITVMNRLKRKTSRRSNAIQLRATMIAMPNCVGCRRHKAQGTRTNCSTTTFVFFSIFSCCPTHLRSNMYGNQTNAVITFWSMLANRNKKRHKNNCMNKCRSGKTSARIKKVDKIRDKATVFMCRFCFYFFFFW